LIWFDLQRPEFARQRAQRQVTLHFQHKRRDVPACVAAPEDFRESAEL
jgi:hypothetical protein